MQTKAASLGLTLLGDVDFCDVTLVCGDGSHLPCHRAVLASASTFLRQILYESLQQRTLLFLGQVEVEEVRALLELLYTGTSSLTQDRIPALQALATNLRLEALTNQLNMLDNSHQQLSFNVEDGTNKDDASNINEDDYKANNYEMASKLILDKNRYMLNIDQANGLTDSDETNETDSSLHKITGFESVSKTEAAIVNQNGIDISEQIKTEKDINDLIVKEEIDELQAPNSRNQDRFCPHCFKVIKGGNLKRHIDRRHKSRKVWLNCDDCEKPFTSKEGLKRHKIQNRCRINEELFPELFPEACTRGCGRRFKTLSTVEKHCRVMCPIKLKCHKCKEDFAKITELTKHMKLCQVMVEVEDEEVEVEDDEEFGIRVNKR